MSGFGLTAASAAPTTPMATGRPEERAGGSAQGTDSATASQFAAMLVALLGGTDARAALPERVPDVQRPIGRDDDAGRDDQQAADALRYGILVEELQPMAPIAPPEPPVVAMPPMTLLPPMELAPPVAFAPPASSLPDTPPTAPTRALDGLTPEFRTRLERVLTRMRDEFGHDVQVVETTRTPERQALLYAQGRTRPGTVVTWTRNSAHLTGDAADVIIDGQWRNDQAYGRLHRVAQEEGLRTLGSRDPGHLELPAAVRGESVTLAERATAHANGHAHSSASEIARAAVARATSRTPRGRTDATVTSMRASAPNVDASAGGAAPAPDASAPIDVAKNAPPAPVVATAPRVAVAAPIAAVATVARVAGTASVARPGAASGTRAGAADRSVSDLATAERGASTPRRARDDDAPVLATSTRSQGAFRAATTTEQPTTRIGAGIDRVDQVTGIAARSPREVAQLTLALDGDNGRRDEVTIGVRGTQVDATIVTTDAGTADRLRDNVIDLRRALESRGLGVDEFRTELRRGTEGTDAARVVAAADREALRVRLGGDAGEAAFSRDQDARGRHDGERRADRDGRGASDERHPFTGQDQRERQQAAREQAARLAAFRRAGRPTYGDDAA